MLYPAELPALAVETFSPTTVAGALWAAGRERSFNRSVAATQGLRGGYSGSCVPTGSTVGNFDLEGGAGRRIGELQGAAVGGDEFVGDGKAEPCSAPPGRAVESLE